MNTWKIEWDLTLSKNEVINLLQKIIQPKDSTSAKPHNLKGNILGHKFEVIVKRSLVWGTVFRREIEGKGSVVDSKDGSRMSALFEVCAPYKYVNLNSKNLSVIIPILILSWIGLIFSHIYAEILSFLDFLLMSSFFITCAVLLLGFMRYVSIDDKFKEIIKIFEETFNKHRHKGR